MNRTWIIVYALIALNVQTGIIIHNQTKQLRGRALMHRHHHAVSEWLAGRSDRFDLPINLIDLDSKLIHEAERLGIHTNPAVEPDITDYTLPIGRSYNMNWKTGQMEEYKEEEVAK